MFYSLKKAGLRCFHHNAVKLVSLLSTVMANIGSWHRLLLSHSAEFYV